jgi:hypothetical protein
LATSQRRSNTTREPIQASPYSLTYDPMPRSRNTPTTSSGSVRAVSRSTEPMLLSTGWTIFSIITSVDATRPMPRMQKTKTVLYGRT